MRITLSIPVVLSAITVVFAIESASGSARGADSVAEVIASYDAARKGGGPRLDDATWFRALTEAVERNPDDPSAAKALGYARLHANALGKWDESIRILERLVDLEPPRNAPRARLLTELGEIRKQLSATTRLDSDRAAARSAFEEANTILAEIGSASDDGGEADEAILLNIAWISQLLAESDSPADTRLAALSFRSLREGIERYRTSHGEPRHRLAVAGWTPLKVAEQESIEALVNEQYAEATEAIDAVARAADGSVTPSHCIIEAAYRKMLPKRNDVGGYVDFLRTALRTAPEDDGTCIVRWMLAEALLRQGDKAEARTILEDLRDHAMVAFDTVEPGALERGAGGTYSRVLRTLRDLEAEGGDSEKALATNSTYLDLYPNDGGLVREAKSFADRIFRETEATQRLREEARPASSWRRILLLANVVVILSLAGWIALRARGLRRSE